MKVIKNAIKKRVNELDITQNDIAAFLDITPTAYHRAFREKSWKLRQLEKIGNFLGGSLVITIGDKEAADFIDPSEVKVATPEKRIGNDPEIEYIKEFSNKLEIQQVEIDMLKKLIDRQEEDISFYKRLLSK